MIIFFPQKFRMELRCPDMHIILFLRITMPLMMPQNETAGGVQPFIISFRYKDAHTVYVRNGMATKNVSGILPLRGYSDIGCWSLLYNHGLTYSRQCITILHTYSIMYNWRLWLQDSVNKKHTSYQDSTSSPPSSCKPVAGMDIFRSCGRMVSWCCIQAAPSGTCPWFGKRGA